MRENNTNNRNAACRLALVVLGVFAMLASMALFVSGRPNSSIGITVTNNSAREIRHLYLAPGNPDNWGMDQMNGSTIPSGNSFTLNNVSCDGSNTNIIAEDENGCFYYSSVSCGANATWTIASDATPDCGN
jgi:hypothetical protein